MSLRVLLAVVVISGLSCQGVWAGSSRGQIQTVARKSTARRGGKSGGQSRANPMQQQMQLRAGQMRANSAARAAGAKHHQQWRQDALLQAQRIREAKAAEAAKSGKLPGNGNSSTGAGNSGKTTSTTGADLKVAQAGPVAPAKESSTDVKKP